MVRPRQMPRRPLTGLLFLAIMLLAAAAGCAGPAGDSPAAQPLHAVKLLVERDGVYEVPASALQKAGLKLPAGSLDGLALSTGGQPVAYTVVDDGARRALRFYGQALGPAAYMPQNVYWLQEASAEPTAPAIRQMPQRAAALAAGVEAAQVVSATVRAEEQRQYLSQVGRGDDRWFWKALFAPDELELSVHTPHAVPREAGLRIRLWANSTAPVEPDHHVVVYLNGERVADSAWDGLGAHAITATLPAGVLQAGENRLTIQAPGDTGARADSVLLDWVEISYSRLLVFDGGLLPFAGQAQGFAVQIPQGLTEQTLSVWDITNPVSPIMLSGYRIEGDRLLFASDNTPRRFVIFSDAGVSTPQAVAPAENSALTDWPGGADLIIVTVAQYREALQPLVAARRNAGLRVALVDVAAVYDTFNHGRADPAAIRALVHHARSRWSPPAPRFLLLAGDASYDPRGYLGGAEADLVPTQLVDTTFAGWTASDVWYALPASDNTGETTPPGATAAAQGRGGNANDSAFFEPQVAVGRLPAQTARQLQVMVAKTLAYERAQMSGPGRESVLLLADNDDPAFTAVAQRFAETLGGGITSEVVTISGDGAEARSRLSRAFHDGAGLVGYFGHGSMTLWAQEKVLSVEDVPALANNDRPPIVFTVTCLSGLFNHPTGVSLGEALLRAEGAGAVAALVPSGAGTLGEQRPLADALARSLAALQSGDAGDSAVRLGDIMLQAQGNLPETSETMREIALTFNLLGDPTLPVRR